MTHNLSPQEQRNLDRPPSSMRDLVINGLGHPNPYMVYDSMRLEVATSTRRWSIFLYIETIDWTGRKLDDDMEPFSRPQDVPLPDLKRSDHFYWYTLAEVNSPIGSYDEEMFSRWMDQGLTSEEVTEGQTILDRLIPMFGDPRRNVAERVGKVSVERYKHLTAAEAKAATRALARRKRGGVR